MTREEARKLAEKYADTRWGTKEQARKLSVEWNPQMYDAERQETVLAYMACYDALTKGEPECWVVGHETKGYNGASLNFQSADTARMMHVDEEYGGDSYDCDELDESWKKAEEDGWFVVPVKLLRVEGSSK